MCGMDEKQKQAERELLELITRCRAVRDAIKKLEQRWGKAGLAAEGFDWAWVNSLVDLEERAWRAAEMLKKPKGEP